MTFFFLASRLEIITDKRAFKGSLQRVRRSRSHKLWPPSGASTTLTSITTTSSGSEFAITRANRVDCDATDIAAPDLDFSSMQTRTQGQANLFGCGRKCRRTTYGATGSIDGGENAVSSVLDQIAAVPFNRLARQLIVTVQQPTPVMIADFGSAAS